MGGALRLGEDGWRSDPVAVGGGGSRKQTPSEVIHPNGKTEVESRGAGSSPNRVWGRERCPSISSSDFSFASGASCRPIPVPKKGNAKECSNYRTIALISHASKVMLKILQAKL